MASKQCSSCGGSGYNAMRGVIPGSQKNAPTCSTCGGKGWVYVNESSPNLGGGVSGGSSGSCFPGGTMISTPFGDQDIAAVDRNDWVLSVDPTTGRPVPSRVLAVRRHSACQIWRLRLENGLTVRTTSCHSFAFEDGWVRAARIRPGNRIVRYNTEGAPQLSVIAESAPCDEIEDVYNLIVGGTFNFIADGALVHSFSYLRGLRAIFWKLTAYDRLAKKSELATAR